MSYYARVYNALLTLYHIPDQLSTATEYFLLSEFQRRLRRAARITSRLSLVSDRRERSAVYVKA